MMAKKRILNGNICGAIVVALATVSNAFAANVVQRNTVSNRVSTTRPTAAAARMPTMSVTTTATSSTSTTPAPETTAAPAATTTVTETPTPVVENKSNQFGTGLTSKSETIIDTAAANLAELVRAQRAALDASGAGVPTATQTMNTTGTGENICDTALRECMIQRCGTGFTKCVSDTDTTFFDKMDTCRRTTNCTGREYQLFSTEIKADRDFNAKLANYNATIDCGNNYDKCIIEQCGPTYSKCIGKSAGDTAIAKCDSIAKSCTQYDSGLAMRTMGVFADVRQTAERQIAADEKTLYALRDQMRALCGRLGAMFDERSLDCVYTVNFYAGDNTLFASKKAYAGGTFDCTQNWFGIDVTTFRENAFRETRAQTAASSAMLGSGVGQAVGAITSGAIDRAVARHTADRALNNAIKECMETHNMTEAECRAKTGSESQNPSTTTNGSAVKLPADIGETLKDIPKKQDQEINDMVIEDPDITDVSLDPLENNLTVDPHQPNANEEEEKPSDDNKTISVDNTNAQTSWNIPIIKVSGADSVKYSLDELNQNTKSYLAQFFRPDISDDTTNKIKDFIAASTKEDPNSFLETISVFNANRVEITLYRPSLDTTASSNQTVTNQQKNDTFCNAINQSILGGASSTYKITSASDIDYSKFGCTFTIYKA